MDVERGSQLGLLLGAGWRELARDAGGVAFGEGSVGGYGEVRGGEDGVSTGDGEDDVAEGEDGGVVGEGRGIPDEILGVGVRGDVQILVDEEDVESATMALAEVAPAHVGVVANQTGHLDAPTETEVHVAGDAGVEVRVRLLAGG